MKLKNLSNRIRGKIKALSLPYQYADVLNRNSELKNIHKEKRCFIIGNGPSIKEQDLLKLRDEQTFVVNSFWNHPQYKEINPKYHVIIDADVFPIDNQKNNFFSKEILKNSELLNSCSTKLFFHAFGKKFVEKNGVFDKNNIYYLLSRGQMGDGSGFNVEIDRIIPNTKNVIVATIIIAAYMGFDEIYLLGCEHDFLAYPSDKHYEKFPHFFDNPYDSKADKNPTDYYAMSVVPYENRIYQAGILFKNYRLLKEKLSKERPDIKIYNATPNSFLDVFPKTSFEDIKL